ncbi:TetR/AcrR family transcriptional regulator [Nocardia sp. CA2R105]|uniref:TetR/AcrR family transcriptional regulator n=1 Tax=Nocardia coffeae TaxID=2873381 RepID=UPI001CA5F98B|nr:TetR/AcrR family transcriptional regulator [Nocardia coffeae]MBY8860469.1 TetR/AcrR family transcriptional regulator [Nocardia coffeae]
MTDEQSLGLRERKKLDTRRALSDAALELMFERGLENVVREDIAARAGVSVRTFNNYFSSKFEALAYRQIERVRRAAEILRDRPADEPLWTAIIESVIAPFEADGVGWGPPTPAILAEIRKLPAAPEMHTAFVHAVGDELVAAVAVRTGTTPADLYPKLVAAAVNAAFVTTFDVYAHTDPPQVVTTILRRALTELARGLPDPSV